MAEGFVSLASLVRGSDAPSHPSEISPALARSEICPAVTATVDFAHAATIHELALVRLAAFEAFERASARLLRALAEDVLGRELALGAADLSALAARALERFAAAAPLGLAVSAFDAPSVRTAFPVRVDPALVAGDLVVDVREGTLEARFAMRLDDALSRAQEAEQAA